MEKTLDFLQGSYYIKFNRTESELTMSIAKTIQTQIKTLDSSAFMAWGAKNFVAGNSSLKFQSSGMVSWKGHILIEYKAGADLYTIKFFKIRKAQMTNVDEIEGVYASDLVKIIDKKVG